MFGRVLNMPLITDFISGPYTNIWVDKTEVLDVFSWRYVRVVHVPPLKSFANVPNKTRYV